MNRKFSWLVISAALCAGSNFALADAKVNGFADITYMVKDSNSTTGGLGGTQGKFAANAEADFAGSLGDKTSFRMDADFGLGINGGTSASSATGDARQGPADAAIIEQVYFATKPLGNVTVLGGVFNNPLSWEKEDAPDMYTTSHGQIYNRFDGQTILYGNNIAGLAAAGTFGPVTLTAALLNDLYQTDKKNSAALVASITPVKGLDAQLGYVTQASKASSTTSINPLGAGNVLDVNATFKTDSLTVGTEYMSADEVVDKAMGITANYAINDSVGVTGRYDTVSYQLPGIKDTTSTTLAASVKLDKGLTAVAEIRKDDNGTKTSDLVQLEFIAAF